MWQIFVYNWPFYLVAGIVSLAAIVLLRHADQEWMRITLYTVALAAAYFAVSSLAVSHYVYDVSPLYAWDWIPSALGKMPASFVNIHAGLDESSGTLALLFPNARREVLDIYSDAAMSEASIRRARQRAQQVVPSRSTNPLQLSLEDSAWEVVFLLFVAHELRERATRIAFFREIHRLLEASGRVMVVEHLRDWKSFLAYGPGALHFHAGKEWHVTFRSAGFEIASQFNVTPFVRCFVLVKEDAEHDSKARKTAGV